MYFLFLYILLLLVGLFFQKPAVIKYIFRPILVARKAVVAPRKNELLTSFDIANGTTETAVIRMICLQKLIGSNALS